MARHIVCETKKGYRKLESFEPVVFPIEAFFIGGEVVVNHEHSILLHNLGYGNLLGQRMNFVNDRCFPTPSIEFIDNNEPSTSSIAEFSVVPLEEELKVVGHVRLVNVHEGDYWLERVNNGKKLYLSQEEAIYLIMDKKITVKKKSLKDLWDKWMTPDFLRKYFVYKHFRLQGWTVKAGLVFGGDFSLYKLHPEHCHSSAIVRINMKPECLEITSMKRELKNVKKALLLATIELPDDLTELSPFSDLRVTVTQESSWLRGSELIKEMRGNNE
ncbi:unnamed protein product [Bursaphelenchus xylophilus]|uniref:tRNA-intron lyase n=1 Tax=Bursaphelenchus xylophilus TaxID=6326 RepID=A0A1I7RLG6_BURXY|nr:unnamed protein product [Bursaphelenchus xylophilus]CAG9083004.1 unnamed protein product [Bursaphelenchus xylophilus]